MALIRIAGPDDADGLVRLINAAFLVERFFVDADRIDMAQFRQHFETGVFLIAADDGKPAGCVYVELRGERAYMGMLAVDPARQGSGLGRSLVNAAEGHCRDHGCLFLDLRVVNLREELPPFYRRMGYGEMGTEPFPPDVETKMPCHLIRMSKAL